MKCNVIKPARYIYVGIKNAIIYLGCYASERYTSYPIVYEYLGKNPSEKYECACVCVLSRRHTVSLINRS